MKWLMALMVTLMVLNPAAADHYYPKVGEEVQVRAWCETIDDMRAMILSGFPNNIPDHIDCWASYTPLKGTMKGKVAEQGPWDIIEVVDVKQRTTKLSIETGDFVSEYVFTDFGQEGDQYFLPVRRTDKDV